MLSVPRKIYLRGNANPPANSHGAFAISAKLRDKIMTNKHVFKEYL